MKIPSCLKSHGPCEYSFLMMVLILQKVRIITSNEDLAQDEECCPSLLVTTGGGDDILGGLYQVINIKNLWRIIMKICPR